MKFYVTKEFLEMLLNKLPEKVYNKKDNLFDLTSIFKSTAKRECTEELADLAHEQWSGWMGYLFEKSTENPDGTVIIPKWAVDRWKRQMNTSYEELSEDEKECNRIEARKFINTVFEGE